MAEAAAWGFSSATNPEILCPTTGLVCPARAELVENFASFVSPEVDAQLPPELKSHLNGSKLRVRLGEYSYKATVIGCNGPKERICPTRTAFDQSPARRRAVTILRQLLGKQL